MMPHKKSIHGQKVTAGLGTGVSGGNTSPSKSGQHGNKIQANLGPGAGSAGNSMPHKTCCGSGSNHMQASTQA